MALFAGRAVHMYGSLEAWPVGLGVPEDAVARLKGGLLRADPSG